MLKTFEDLDVWKRSCQLSVDICNLAEHINNFALRDQISRSAISIPSNIAEGSERDSTPNFIRFLRYSKASCAELRTQLYILSRINTNSPLLEKESLHPFIKETKELNAMLQGLINSLKKQ